MTIKLHGPERNNKYVAIFSRLQVDNFLPLQVMIREQDHTIDSIAGTLNTLAQQASLMGHEINEHNECVYR
jgi:hypothetical protein